MAGGIQFLPAPPSGAESTVSPDLDVSPLPEPAPLFRIREIIIIIIEDSTRRCSSISNCQNVMFHAKKKEKKKRGRERERERKKLRKELDNERKKKKRKKKKKKKEIMRAKLIMPPDVNHYVSPSMYLSLSLSLSDVRNRFAPRYFLKVRAQKSRGPRSLNRFAKTTTNTACLCRTQCNSGSI
ncbi:hypothetical protein PUN28_015668 [Cardiocondyla obscurior]|uniref:Uncharacterized protein n=1 Tax=Cardiocondyla obscurior TaxID=286306 RepID=A0AAW2EY24_9HYME